MDVELSDKKKKDREMYRFLILALEPYPNPQNPQETFRHNWFSANDTYLDINQSTETPHVPQWNRQVQKVLLFMGGRNAMKCMKERVNRVKLSLEKDNYSGPLVGFIWPSDTAWFGAKFIATANGAKDLQI